MNWQLLPQFTVTGLLAGGPLALTALGLVLIFKSTYIFNFAQGQLLLLGALITWWFAVELGLPLGLAVLLALMLSALLGLLIERLALRPMTGQPLLSIILMTLGLSQLLQGMALLLFGGVQRNFPQIFAAGTPYRITTPFLHNENPIVVILKQNLVWSFVVAIVGVLVISLFFRFTRIGLAMRGASEDHELAQSVGLRIHRIFGLSWALAGVVATTGGVLLATSSGLDMSSIGRRDGRLPGCSAGRPRVHPGGDHRGPGHRPVSGDRVGLQASPDPEYLRDHALRRALDRAHYPARGPLWPEAHRKGLNHGCVATCR